MNYTISLFLKITTLLFFVGFSHVSYARELDAEIEFVVDYLRDEKGLVAIDNIQNQTFTELSNSHLGFNDATFWFKVTLNSTQNIDEINFSLSEAPISYLEVFSEHKSLFQIQSNSPIYNSTVEHLPVFDTYYFKVRFDNQVFFGIEVFDSSQFKRTQTVNTFANGWYYGYVFMVLIVNLFFYFSLRNTPFLSYSFFMVAINIGISIFDGVLGIFLPTSWIQIAIPIVHFSVGVSGTWFATGFLNLNEYHSKAKYVAYLFLGTGFLGYGIYYITGEFKYLAFGDLFTYLILVIYWFMGVIVIKKHQFAIFFVVGYFLVMMAGLFHVTPINFGLHMFPISFGFVKFGAVFEMLILTYAITYRVKIMQEENNSIKNELKNYMSQIFSLEERMNIQDSDSNSTPEITVKIDNLAKEFDLTDREVDVLLCIANQSTNANIAEELFISVNTVKYHTRNIYQKLNINSKGDAISLLKG